MQFKEIQKFVKDHQEPQYILVHASKLEEGYLAISLLAGIYNEIHSRGEWEEGAEPDIQWSDSWQCLPIIPFKEADDYYNWQENDFSSFGNSFLASQKTNDTFVPYWAENEDKPVCISMENISFFRCDPIIDTLNSFRSNEQVYVLILHEENDFDSFNSFGGFGGFDTFESNEDKNLNQIILSLTAEELEIPKTSSVSLYYENIWKQMVTNSGCKLERKFPVHDFLLDIEKMNKEFSYDFLDKILKYALRNKEHGILRKKDFQFMERFAGKRGPAEQKTETRSAIRCLREDLIGMDQVKEQVMETVQVMKFNRLRKEMGIIPPGDLRNCLVALADREPLMERIMQFRFNDGSPLAGHNFGNLFIAAMAEAEGSMEAGLAATSQILNVRGKVIPSTLSDIRLKAEMTDGTLIEGESEIPKAHKRIRRVGIEPSNVQATSSAVDAIMKADVLILGPGSLYTSVIPNLMVEGIREAVLRSDAVKIYVCNVMTQPGETDGYGAFEHVQALITHAGAQFLDYVIVNDQNVTETQLAQYQLKGSIPVTPDIKKIERLGIKVVPKSLISNKDLVRHNPQKLAQAVISLIYRLRLFGKGFRFFDYFFMRQSMRKLKNKSV